MTKEEFGAICVRNIARHSENGHHGQCEGWDLHNGEIVFDAANCTCGLATAIADIDTLIEDRRSRSPFECMRCHFQFGSRAHADDHECPPPHPATYPFGAMERPR